MNVKSLVQFLFYALVAVALTATLGYAQEADLLVTKSGPAQASAGSDVSYTVTVLNLGPDDAANVVLTDSTPFGPPDMTFVAANQATGPAFACSTPAVGATGTISCTAAALPASASATFTFVFHIPGATPLGTIFVNIATATSNTFDPNSENDSGLAATSTPPAPQADMGVVKTAAEKAGPDTDVVYTIVVTNGGPDGASNMTLDDTLPGTMTFVSLAQAGTPLVCSTPAVGTNGTVTCTAATYAAGATTTLTLTGHIPAGTPFQTFFQDFATVASTTADPNSENDTSPSGLFVSNTDLSVTKSGPGTVTAGDTVTYTVSISTAGPDPAFNARFNDALPPNTTFVSVTQDSGPAAICSTPPVGGTGTATCVISTFPSGASATFTLIIRAGDTTSITNTVSATSDSFDPNPNNDTASATTTVIPSADVGVAKSGPAIATAGENLTYTITATNAGPSSASTISLTDTLPPDTTFVSLNQTVGPTFTCVTPTVGAAGTITCTIATLAPGASATFSIVFRLSTSAERGQLINTATLTAATPDPIPGNGSSAVSTAVNPAAVPMLSLPAFAILALTLALVSILALRSRSFPASDKEGTACESGNHK